MFRKFFISSCLMAVVLCGMISVARAATVTVTSTLDPDNTTGSCVGGGLCSIRQAINTAGAGDTILFNIPPAGCPAGVCTIDLSLGGLLINKALTITGPGARGLIVHRADGTNPSMFTIFSITSANDMTVNLSGLAVTNGSTMGSGGGIICDGPIHVNLTGLSVTDSAGFAGGIFNNGGVLTILNSTISHNAGSVGGIANNLGYVAIANSTISGNRGGGNGLAGGIANGISDNTSVTLDLNNVTITGNTQEGDDILSTGGVRNFGTLHSRNSIFQGNTADIGSADDVRGIFLSQGTNLVGSLSGSIGFGLQADIIGQNAFLLGPSNFGGQTNTYAISNLFPFSSSAIDSANNCVVTATCAINNPPVPLIYDQRGAPYTRNSGSTVDIGAFEFQPEPSNKPGTVGGRVYASTGGGLGNATVILTGGNGLLLTALTNPSGFFRFDNVAAGQAVTISVQSKRMTFAPQTVSVLLTNQDTYFIPQ